MFTTWVRRESDKDSSVLAMFNKLSILTSISDMRSFVTWSRDICVGPTQSGVEGTVEDREVWEDVGMEATERLSGT